MTQFVISVNKHQQVTRHLNGASLYVIVFRDESIGYKYIRLSSHLFGIMQSSQPQHDITQSTISLAKESNQNDEAYVAVQVANAKLAIANIQNQKLRQRILEKDEIIRDYERMIDELKIRLYEQQQKAKSDQWIRKEITQRLETVQGLLSKLFEQKANHNFSINLPQTRTPNLKKPKIPINQRQSLHTQNNISQYEFSSRSTKTVPISLSSSTYKSTRPCYQSQQYKRYRRQKLMRCNNLQQVLRVQELID